MLLAVLFFTLLNTAILSLVLLMLAPIFADRLPKVGGNQ
jgi:hypothetical protein